MKIPIFLVILFFSLSVKAKQKKNKIQIPLFHVTRENYFENFNSADGKVIAPPLMAPRTYGGLAFVAEVYLGSPSVRQYLHVDTGSTLTWTQCFPCSHSFVDHIYPKYWPEDSNTYRDAECETTANTSNPKFSYSDSSGVCNYEQTYLDRNLIRGRLAEEMITLQTRNGEFAVVYDVYFGCNDQAVGKNYIGTGILGLAAGNFSLVEKLGSKFSLCFGWIRESKPTHNLILGDGANIQGHPTVFNITKGHYMFTLEFILVGEELKTLDDPIQVYLDTGTMVSHFSGYLYDFIVGEVKKLVGDRFTSVPYESFLCYKAEIRQIPDQIDIGFIFAGEAELFVSMRSLFLPNGFPGTLCLTVNKNSEQEKNINIIGAVAMQGYNLGYDLKSNTAYFNKQNCSM